MRQQTTLSVTLEVKPASHDQLNALIDRLHDNGTAPHLDTRDFGWFMQGVPSVHFLSMIVFPGDDYDPLFVLEANFDGEMVKHTLLNESATGKLQLLNVAAGVAYELDHQLWIRALYQRAHDIGESHSTLASANHNRVTVSVERNFTLPIGR